MVQIFVISLNDASERQAHMVKQLQGIPFQFSPATNGKRLTQAEQILCDQLQNNQPSDKYQRRLQKIAQSYPALLPGEIGCYLSHYQLLQKIARAKIDIAVILEDDIILQNGWHFILEQLKNCNYQWDMVRLCGLRKRRFTKLTALNNDYDLVKLHNVACGTQGYVVNAQGAEKLCQLLEMMLMPVDITLDDYWQYDISLYAVQPYPIAINNMASMIDGAEIARAPRKEYRHMADRLYQLWLKQQKSYLKRQAIKNHQPQKIKKPQKK